MSEDRHTTLIRAGWRYDVNRNYYSEPGSATDGTARQYDIDAAWMTYQAALSETGTGKREKPIKDPRQQEPQ